MVQFAHGWLVAANRPAVGALLGSDERGPLAVGIGVAFLTAALAVAGPVFLDEWHSWAGGRVLTAAGILVWDSKRQGLRPVDGRDRVDRTRACRRGWYGTIGMWICVGIFISPCIVARTDMPRVTNKGRVVIPEAVRDALGIEPGDDVVFEETDAGYLLRKQDTTSAEG